MKSNLITGALITGATLGALVTGSMAADMRAPMLMKAPPPPPSYSWTGCWVSGGVGYGLWNQDHSVTNLGVGVAGTISTTDGGRGWLGRAGVGCDYQVSSSFVLGVFGDYDFMSLKGTNSPSEIIGIGGITFPLSANMTEDRAWAFGARIGYVVYPNLLTYVDGGYTQTRFTQTNLFANSGAPIAFGYPNYSVSGWFLGGGTEYQVPWAGFNGLFWRSEYRFATYNKTDQVEVSTITGVPDGNVLHSQAFVQTATTSLVFKFNWGH
jgi:outer membrane immunogenic protein